MKHLPGCNCTCPDTRRDIDKNSDKAPPGNQIWWKGNKLMKGDRVMIAL